MTLVMLIHRLVKVVTVLFLLAVPSLILPSTVAYAGKAKHAVKGGKAKKSGKGKHARRGRSRGKFMGHGVSMTDLRTEELPKPSGNVSVFSVNLKERVDVNIFREDGSYDQAALAKLDHVFRCRRTGEERAVDPRLYEILSIIYDKYGKTVELNSGFRYQRNEGSRHFHGSAMDLFIPGVGQRDLYAFAQTLDRGGMGMGKYPHSNFVHIDFRAPGEPSYRWVDTQRHNRRAEAGKIPSKMWKRSSRPNT